jgi:hypothetical protein
MRKLEYRQGDVSLWRIDKPEKTGKLIASGKLTLALGEVTGHSHTLVGEVAEFSIDGERVFWVEAPAVLDHQEHAAQTVQAGWFVIDQPQVQYTPQAIQRVLD